MIRSAMRPDGRARVWLPQDDPGSWPSQVDELAADLGVPLILLLDDDGLIAPAEAAGFRLTRHEQVWRVPLRAVPIADTGVHHIRTAHDVDLGALAALDNEIRHDIPGMKEWNGTVDDLRETLEDEEFDPALYLVAEHVDTGNLDGLVRVWWRTPDPRLGCMGVRPGWHRTRLAPMLLGTVAHELRGRGVTHIVTETDETNQDSHVMAQRRGGQPTQKLVELVRD